MSTPTTATPPASAPNAALDQATAIIGIATQLNELAQWRQQTADLSAATQSALKLLGEYAAGLHRVPTTLQAFLDAQRLLENAQRQVATLEEAVKAETLAARTTIHGGTLVATFHEGRISWNTPGLEGYAEGHPAVLRFRHQGDPYVQIQPGKTGTRRGKADPAANATNN